MSENVSERPKEKSTAPAQGGSAKTSAASNLKKPAKPGEKSAKPKTKAKKPGKSAGKTTGDKPKGKSKKAKAAAKAGAKDVSKKAKTKAKSAKPAKPKSTKPAKPKTAPASAQTSGAAKPGAPRQGAAPARPHRQAAAQDRPLQGQLSLLPDLPPIPTPATPPMAPAKKTVAQSAQTPQIGARAEARKAASPVAHPSPAKVAPATQAAATPPKPPAKPAQPAHPAPGGASAGKAAAKNAPKNGPKTSGKTSGKGKTAAKASSPKPAAKTAASEPAANPSAKPLPKPLPRSYGDGVAATSPGFRVRARHVWMVFTFLLFVALPTGGAWWYLDNRAADQYASTVGFVVRQADSPTSGGGVLGTIATLSGGSSSDTDILYEFIKSQQLIELVDEKLDLRNIYNLPENDPVFTLGPDASIEDLIWYWSWAVRIFYDPGTGLIELRVLAFTPDDARNIAEAISRESSAMINELSAIAREDTTRYAREELDKAVDRLKETRQTLTAFRNSSQIVDPTADVQGRMGLLNYLQQQLADTIIEQDLLQETARPNDPRLQLTQRKIIVIQQRIAEERQKIGLGDNGTGEAAAALVGQYEGLIVDREFAEQAYVKALSNYDAAVAEANRKSRYLAEYIKPTISQEAQYPQRYIITALLGLFLFLFWFILLLVYYSIKDRR